MTDGQSASLPWCRFVIWCPMTRFLFSVWQLRVSSCGAPSLTRGWVCNLLYNCFWALPEQSLLGQSRTGPITILTVSSETPPTCRARSPVFISPRNKVSQLYPRALDSLFLASYDSEGYGGGILTRIQSQSHVTTEGQYVLVSGPLWNL
jgi:hypothetical protein